MIRPNEYLVNNVAVSYTHLLVYATCSLLDAENEGVVSSFLSAHPEFVTLSAAEVLRRQAIEIDCDHYEGGLRLSLIHI